MALCYSGVPLCKHKDPSTTECQFYDKDTQEDAWSGMCWCKEELCWMGSEIWAVYQQQMCAGETEMFY